MKLTPIDIQQQQFRKTLRGYDVSEVDGFLELMGELVTASLQRLLGPDVLP